MAFQNWKLNQINLVNCFFNTLLIFGNINGSPTATNDIALTPTFFNSSNKSDNLLNQIFYLDRRNHLFELILIFQDLELHKICMSNYTVL